MKLATTISKVISLLLAYVLLFYCLLSSNVRKLIYANNVTMIDIKCPEKIHLITLNYMQANCKLYYNTARFMSLKYECTCSIDLANLTAKH